MVIKKSLQLGVLRCILGIIGRRFPRDRTYAMSVRTPVIVLEKIRPAFSKLSASASGVEVENAQTASPEGHSSGARL